MQTHNTRARALSLSLMHLHSKGHLSRREHALHMETSRYAHLNNPNSQGQTRKECHFEHCACMWARMRMRMRVRVRVRVRVTVCVSVRVCVCASAEWVTFERQNDRH